MSNEELERWFASIPSSHGYDIDAMTARRILDDDADYQRWLSDRDQESRQQQDRDQEVAS
jgi:hypothetical protein